ncbi:MAG: beta-hydroxyacyl-ACP dehydratase [Verrucomicrobia bacterium]|nr:beta-hydroxyacyl-ACP dehydratase [Verrucomicrobiota bacterium]MCF7708615.1 beta-hydroxyacyl-ACP dehydratase [Verrucomicrobiota bacterium]
MIEDHHLEEALSRLPHGTAFRFVDRLTALEPGHSGSGEYTVRGDEEFLKAHFPGNPVFPGVLLVEAAAQLAGVVAQSDPLLTPLRELRLTALQSVKILGSARPGQTIGLYANISGRLGDLIQAEAAASVEGAKVMEARICLSGKTSDL